MWKFDVNETNEWADKMRPYWELSTKNDIFLSFFFAHKMIKWGVKIRTKKMLPMSTMFLQTEEISFLHNIYNEWELNK